MSRESVGLSPELHQYLLSVSPPEHPVLAELREATDKLKERNIEVLLCGMQAARNMGDDYRKRFDAIFPELAAKYDAVFYPFFLDGVVSHADLQLEDGMHPNSKGVAVMVDKMLPSVHQFLKSLGVNE